MLVEQGRERDLLCSCCPVAAVWAGVDPAEAPCPARAPASTPQEVTLTNLQGKYFYKNI